eukprot:s394_g14.t2
MTAELTSDEFLRLQEELLNLKMQTEELRQENARLLRHVQEPQLMGNMEALRKAGAGAVSGAVGAVSAIGQRAGASLKSSLDGSTFQGHFQAESHGHGREVADAEVSALHERLKEVTEELNAARQDAMLAQREATAAEGHTPNGSGPPVQDVLTVSQALLLKVQQQQRDLERVREAVDGQQAQVQRLTEKAASERMTKPAAAALPGLEEQLRSAEGKLDQLGRRLQSSQGTSRLTYELRCHMESVLDRVRQRDNAIEQLLTRQERMEHASVMRRERLAFAQEDLLSQWMRKELPCEPLEGGEVSPSSSSSVPFARESVEEEVDQLDLWKAVGVQVSNEDTAELGWEAAVAASPTSSLVGDESLEDLEQDLEALRRELQNVQLKNRQKAEELRAHIREHQRKLDAEAEAKEASTNGSPSAASAAAGSVASEAFDSILYVQKIEELERQNAGLEQDLELLRSSEQCLQADSQEKEELISFLMRTMRSTEREAEASRPRPGAGSRLLGLLSGRRDRSQALRNLEELEKVAEEALLDNMRLRKDLRTLAEEFGKAVALKPSTENKKLKRSQREVWSAATSPRLRCPWQLQRAVAMGKWNNDHHYHNDSWSVNKNHNQWKKSSSYHRQSSWHKSDRGDRNQSYWRGGDDNDSVSKWLTYVLRHGASEEDIYMDKHGYVSVDQLITLREKEVGKTTSLAKKQNLYQIRLVVETCPKQRFEIWEDEQNSGKTWIRATQGHSISKVQDTVHRPLRSADDLGNEEPVPSLCRLKTMGRNHIHMCMGLPGTGVISGMREDADVAIYINVALAMQSGICFVQSSNGVILTEKMLIWDKQQGDLLEELRKTCEDLADAVDRAEWMEQSQNKKPAAKKMPKPKKMPESLQRCSGAMRPPEPERPPSFLAPTLCKASAPPPPLPVAWPIVL